ncbi:MAG: DUF4870 domain-containing protein [Oscillospiraceae bacterium]|jgi:uncharacterized membrane protein|nr:DUF4870 domain-containing protein [Oscillospiraceae bacterium]
MANCTKCGAELYQEDTVCRNCGAQVVAAQQAPPYYQAPPAANDAEKADAEQNKLMGILAYLCILILVPIFAAKESAFAKFHVNQSIWIWIAVIASQFICGILRFIPVIGFVFSILSGLIGLAELVFVVIGIINAAKGEKKPLPLFGDKVPTLLK